MLLEFSCSNHKSIGEKIVFSLIAGSDTFREEKAFEFGKYKVLPSAVIYGANGSGKSNFIDAISFVKNLVIIFFHLLTLFLYLQYQITFLVYSLFLQNISSSL